MTVYLPDRFARQPSFDQGVPGAAPPMSSFVDSQLHFVQTHTPNVVEQLRCLTIPARDNIRGYTAEFHQLWRRNLNSFLTFVRGVTIIVPDTSKIRTRDTSLRVVTKARRDDWRRPHSRWVVTDAVPLNRGFPPVPPSEAPVAAQCVPTRSTWGRSQPPAPVEPSQPSSSQAPPAGGGQRRKRIHMVSVVSLFSHSVDLVSPQSDNFLTVFSAAGVGH